MTNTRAHVTLALAAVLSVLSVLAGACGDDMGNGTLIGATCAISDECGPAGVCVKGKGGMCTLPCEVSGGPDQCPAYTLCDREEVETDFAGKQEHTLCYPQCDSDSDCRGGYKCKGVSGSPGGKVCQPK